MIRTVSAALLWLGPVAAQIACMLDELDHDRGRSLIIGGPRVSQVGTRRNDQASPLRRSCW